MCAYVIQPCPVHVLSLVARLRLGALAVENLTGNRHVEPDTSAVRSLF